MTSERQPYYTLTQWYTLGQNYPDPSPDVQRLIVDGVFRAMVDEVEIEYGLEMSRFVVQALVDHEALPIYSAAQLILILKAAEICHGNHPGTGSAFAKLFVLISLGRTAHEIGAFCQALRLDELAQKHFAKSDKVDQLAKLVIDLQFDLRYSCPPECARSLYEFAAQSYRSARNALWEGSNTYWGWTVYLRRLLLACTLPLALNLALMVANLPNSKEGAPSQKAANAGDATSAYNEMAQRAMKLRAILLEPIFNVDEIDWLMQEVNLGEEAHANAMSVVLDLSQEVIRFDLLGIARIADERFHTYMQMMTKSHSFDQPELPYDLVVKPDDSAYFERQEFASLLAVSPVRARAHLRASFRNRLSLPRYVFDELDELARKTPG